VAKRNKEKFDLWSWKNYFRNIRMLGRSWKANKTKKYLAWRKL